MTKTMIMQAAVPLFLVLLPIGLGVTAAFAMINVPGLGMLFNSICGWIPVVNPLVTIISVKAYRDVIKLWLIKCFQINLPRRIIIAPSIVVVAKK
uniref:Uncharacterized protein n=1 Tax=Panagrolaimus superbus TaxID=310955 RepID=A0A914Y260_9BILA